MVDSSIIEIVEQFKSRDIAKRMTAVSRAAALNCPESVALMVKALQDPSWSLREHAIARLSGAGDAATPSLLRLLNSGVWYARASAARVLERTGGDSALVPLLLQAGDANASAAQAAEKALAAVIARAGAEGSLAALYACPAAECGRCAAALRKTQPELAARWEAGGVTIASGDAAADAREQDDSAVRLQNLRKSVKSALKQDTKDEDEEP